MAKSVLDDFHIDAGFDHTRREGMPEIMAAEMRQQHLGVLFLLKLILIAVTDNPLNRLIEHTLVGSCSEPVQ